MELFLQIILGLLLVVNSRVAYADSRKTTITNTKGMLLELEGLVFAILATVVLGQAALSAAGL